MKGLPKLKPLQKAQVTRLKSFLRQNAEVSISTADLQDEPTVAGFNWKGIKTKQQEVLKQLVAYQRLARLIPDRDDELIVRFMAEGIFSALQIAAIPRNTFLARYGSWFGTTPNRAEHFYEAALEVKTQVLLHYMAKKQRREPHLAQTNLGQRM